MRFHIPRNRPDLLDEQFIEYFPALGMRTTSNSGAFWGDGDLREQATDYSLLQFAVETKVRFSERYKHCRPTAAELSKACDQLRVRNRHAIRLVLVHNQVLGRYGVAIPEEDVNVLESQGLIVGGTPRTTRGLHPVSYRYLSDTAWESLYDQIDQ